jgi:hypothetical protein
MKRFRPKVAIQITIFAALMLRINKRLRRLLGFFMGASTLMRNDRVHSGNEGGT